MFRNTNNQLPSAQKSVEGRLEYLEKCPTDTRDRARFLHRQVKKRQTMFDKDMDAGRAFQEGKVWARVGDLQLHYRPSGK